MTKHQGSNTVQPIRDKDKIEEIKTILFRQSYRNYFLFFFGINSGLRISDIIRLRVMDVKNRTHFIVKEKKTGNTRRIKINTTLRAEIDKYIKGMADSDFLFPSRQGNKHITREMAYIIINKASRKAGINDNIGTHTLRKTFGYHFYQETKDIAMLQQIFGHSAPSITLRYIGISDDMIDQALDDFSL